MKKCAFLTLEQLGNFVIDDDHAIGPLADIGWRVSTVSWRQSEISWSDYDAVIVRSTWDYWNNVPCFLKTLADINRQTRLANPLEVINWNLTKTYLQDLEGRGIGIVPTCWPNALTAGSLVAYFAELDTDELVVKPVVGGNGEDVYRVSRSDPVERLERIASRLGGRDCMIQKFMPHILAEGEYSLFFFNGEFSHAIVKVPAKAEFRSQEERGAEIRSVIPAEKLLARCRQVLAAISARLLYARIDLVRNDSDDFLLMEVELIEPSMYLRTDPKAPSRFAGAIDKYF